MSGSCAPLILAAGAARGPAAVGCIRRCDTRDFTIRLFVGVALRCARGLTVPDQRRAP